MKPASATALLNLLAAAAAVTALDPSADFCDEDGGGLCLTSFIWCNRQSPVQCSWPEGVSPLNGDAAPYAAVYRGNKYNITWTRGYKHDGPVSIQWLSAADDETEASPIWSTNSTENSFEFDPRAILDGLSPSSISALKRLMNGVESPSNFVKITSQSGSEAMSQQFSVQSSWTQKMVTRTKGDLAEQMSAMEHRWKLGVGIGVGLGIPILAALTWFAASRMSKTSGGKTAD